MSCKHLRVVVQVALAVLTLKPIEGEASALLIYCTSVHLFIPSCSANLGATWQPWSTWRPWDFSGESLLTCWTWMTALGYGEPSTAPMVETGQHSLLFDISLLQNVERSLEALGIKVCSLQLLS